MVNTKTAADGGSKGEHGGEETGFQPAELPRCGAARCPEIAEFYVDWGDADEPIEEVRCAEHTNADTVTEQGEIPQSERSIPDEAKDGALAICFVADKLAEGDRVLFNDRSNELEVTGRHKKPINKTHRRRGTTRDYYDIVELAGNGTVYHLLWQLGSGAEPILRRQSQWDEIETEGGVEYDYKHGGDRIVKIAIQRENHEQ